MKNIGIRIKEIRKENRLTQAEFGKLLSVSQDNVSLWETGKGLPTIQHIVIISKTFNISSDYILGITDF